MTVRFVDRDSDDIREERKPTIPSDDKVLEINGDKIRVDNIVHSILIWRMNGLIIFIEYMICS